MNKILKLSLLIASLMINQVAFSDTANTDNPTNTITTIQIDPDINIEEAIHIGNNLSIATKTLNEHDKSLKANIKLIYPQIIGEVLTTNAVTFNQTMQDMVNDQVKQFKQQLADDQAHIKTLPLASQKNSLRIDYDIDVIHPNHNTVISVRLNVEKNEAGQAHPAHSLQVLNYDLNNNKALALQDLFKPNSHYLSLLASYSKKSLNQKLHKNWANKGAQSDPKNYATWNLQDDTLLITFGEYQVAPYSYGKQEVEIPYAKLKDIISPHSVVYSCTLNPSKCDKG